jgi:hypothetical protein
MRYLITAKYENGATQRYVGIGDRDALMDAIYDDGALILSFMPLP